MYQVFTDDELFCDSRVEELAIISPKITLEVNKAGTFTFTIPPIHPFYDSIKKRDTIITVYRDDDTEPLFEGIAVEVSDDFYMQRTVSCEGELTFFNDTIQRPARYQNMTVIQLLSTYINIHNQLSDDKRAFTLGSVTVQDPNDNIYCYTNYDTTMSSIKEDLVDDLGGYLRVRHEDGVRYLDYLAESPNTNTQVIKLGENLIDFDSNLDTSEIATVVIPLGEILDEDKRTPEAVEGLDERLTIKSVNDGKDYLESADAIDTYGRIEQTVTWDDVTEAANLKTKGQKYLSDTQFENMTIEAKAIDLHIEDSSVESFKMLDKVRVVSAPHGLDKYFMLTKLTYDLNNPENDEFTLGTTDILSMSASTRKENADLIKKVNAIQPSTVLEQAKANAKSLINMASNGYVKIVHNDDMSVKEIQIVDSLDSPTKIWRWNVNGFAYSGDGGETYNLAMTMDGTIVADFIKAGTINGIKFVADEGKFEVTTDGKINFYNEDGVLTKQIREVSESWKFSSSGELEEAGRLNLGDYIESYGRILALSAGVGNCAAIGGLNSTGTATKALLMVDNTEANNPKIRINKLPDTIAGTVNGTLSLMDSTGSHTVSITVQHGLITGWSTT